MDKITNFFKYKKHIIYYYMLLGFDQRQYVTIRVIAESKKKNSEHWYFNNVWFSLIIIFASYILTLTHNVFGTITYDKSLAGIMISGSLTLTGINVIRGALTMISEKLDKSKIDEQDMPNWSKVEEEIAGIKNKLMIRVFTFTVIGTGLYVLQIGQIIKDIKPYVFFFLIIVGLVFVLSVKFSRMVYLMNINFLSTESAAKLLLKNVINQPDDYKKLEETLKQQGGFQ